MNPAQKVLALGAVKSFVAGATGTVLSLNIVDPEHFSAVTLGGWKHLVFAILVSGVVAEARFLNQWAHSGNGQSST